MTPEKRPAEESENEEAPLFKKSKDEGNGSKDEDLHDDDDLQDDDLQDDDLQDDESSQDSIVSTGSNTADGTTSDRLSIPEGHGTLVFCGCTQWDFVGRRKVKNIPSMMHFSPCLWKPMMGIKVAFVAAHSSSVHGIIITAEGKAMSFGRNDKGQLGTGDIESRKAPVVIDSLKELTVVSAAVGRNHSLFLTDRGSVFACGDNKSGQCGVGKTTPIIHTACRISFKESKVVKIACGAEFSMIVDRRGYLHSFGLPEFGQLGHNTDGKYFVKCNKLTFQFETAPKRVPIFVEKGRDGHASPVSDVRVKHVACGNNHTVVVDERGRAFSWGFGGYGRLGHTENKDEMVPRLIKFFDGPKRGVSKVFSGATYTLAVAEMGVFLWGQTKRTGEANMYPKPVQDLCGWDVRDVGCSATSIVVAADQSVIAWGPSPTYGELGLGDNTKSTTVPKESKALDGVRVERVTCSLGFTLLIARDETEEDKQILNKLKVID